MVDMGHSVEVVYGFDGKDAWNKVQGILGV